MLYFLPMIAGGVMLVVVGAGVILASGMGLPLPLLVVFLALLGVFEKPDKKKEY